jgi:hypothetical protein
MGANSSLAPNKHQKLNNKRYRTIAPAPNATATPTMSKPPTADTRSRMMSTALDHQKGNKLWVHDAVARDYSYHPFSSQVSGITPEGPALPTVAMINSARLTGSLAGGAGGGATGASRRGVKSDDDDGGLSSSVIGKTLVAGGRAVKVESHTLYHTPFYSNNGMC